MGGGDAPQQCSLSKDRTSKCGCFSCFPNSKFGCLWEAVGVTGRRQGSGETKELESIAEHFGTCGFLFLFCPTPKETGGQGRAWPKEQLGQVIK